MYVGPTVVNKLREVKSQRATVCDNSITVITQTPVANLRTTRFKIKKKNNPCLQFFVLHGKLFNIYTGFLRAKRWLIFLYYYYLCKLNNYNNKCSPIITCFELTMISSAYCKMLRGFWLLIVLTSRWWRSCRCALCSLNAYTCFAGISGKRATCLLWSSDTCFVTEMSFVSSAVKTWIFKYNSG